MTIADIYAALAAKAKEAAGSWVRDEHDGWQVGWRYDAAHRQSLVLRPPTWPVKLEDLRPWLAALPAPFVALHLEHRGDGRLLLFVLGRFCDMCVKCGAPMDAVGRAAAADECAACALEAGELNHEPFVFSLLAINPFGRSRRDAAGRTVH